MRRICALCMVVLLVLAGVAGCGTAKVRAVYDQPEGPSITIGVASDEFGLGFWHEGVYSGFEVSVAKYVAGKLGYANKQIVFKRVTSADRMQRLADGSVDMLVAGVSMPSAADKMGVSSDEQAEYAGPYLSVSQGVLVRPGKASGITSLASLAGKSVCVVAGSGASEHLLAQQSEAKIHERDTYPQCITDLMAGQSDAIAGDAVILAGLSHEQGSGVAVPVSGVSYGKVHYGIAVKSGASTLAKDIAEALEAMHADGSYDAFLNHLESDIGRSEW